MSGSTPASGKISFNDLQSVFDGTNPRINPIRFDEYYKNASTGYTAGVSGIPNIGTPISLDNFYSKSKTAAPLAVAVTFNTASIGVNSQAGIVNGLTALKNLTIKGFDIAVPGGGTVNVSIYWRNGLVTDGGILSSSLAWTLAGSAVLNSLAGNFQEIPIITTIIVAANANITFLIIITTPSGKYLSYSNGTQLNGTFASNSDMTVKSGYGITSFPIGSSFQPRNFNGNIRYTIP